MAKRYQFPFGYKNCTVEELRAFVLSRINTPASDDSSKDDLVELLEMIDDSETINFESFPPELRNCVYAELLSNSQSRTGTEVWPLICSASNKIAKEACGILEEESTLHIRLSGYPLSSEPVYQRFDEDEGSVLVEIDGMPPLKSNQTAITPESLHEWPIVVSKVKRIRLYIDVRHSRQSVRAKMYRKIYTLVSMLLDAKRLQSLEVIIKKDHARAWAGEIPRVLSPLAHLGRLVNPSEADTGADLLDDNIQSDICPGLRAELRVKMFDLNSVANRLKSWAETYGRATALMKLFSEANMIKWEVEYLRKILSTPMLYWNAHPARSDPIDQLERYLQTARTLKNEEKARAVVEGREE